MNVLGRIFLNSRKDRRKDGVFFVRCRRTYVLLIRHRLNEVYQYLFRCEVNRFENELFVLLCVCIKEFSFE